MVLHSSQAELILETYSLEEILELNDLTQDEVLCFLIEHKLVTVLEPLPIDAEL